MRKTLLTILLSAAAVAAGCQSRAVQHQVVTALPADCFRAEWTRNLDMHGQQPRELSITGDDLFIYSTSNMLYRMNRKSGTLTFESDVAPKGAKVGAPIVQASGTVIVPADTQLLLLDARGFRAGKVDLKRPMRSGLVGDKYGLYVGVDSDRQGGRIGCIELDRPANPFRWQLMTGGAVISTPALYKGVLYAGGDDGKVYAVGADREAVWPIGTFQTGRAIRAGIAADDSGVYVASLDSKLYCLDPGSGKLLWTYYAGMYLINTPVATRTTVYVRVKDLGLVAIDKKEGDYNRKAKWVCPDAVGFLAEDADYALLRTAANHIIAVEKTTGEVKFRSERNDLVAFAVNNVDGVVYCGTKSGQIIAAVAVTKPGSVGQMVFVAPQDSGTLVALR